MIREYLCYKCVCDKCGHNWTTKSNKVPIRCAECNSVKWNEKSAPAPIPSTLGEPESIETVQKDVEPIPDKKAIQNALQAKIDAIVSGESVVKSEPVNEWQGWTEPQQTYDDQAGEMRTYRKHIKTGKVQWLDSESYLAGVG